MFKYITDLLLVLLGRWLLAVFMVYVLYDRDVGIYSAFWHCLGRNTGPAFMEPTRSASL